MPAADTDRTSELPRVSAAPRRRWPWAVLAGAVAMAALGYVLLDGGDGTRITSNASQAPAPALTTTVAGGAVSTVTTVPPAPTTTVPDPVTRPTAQTADTLGAASAGAETAMAAVDLPTPTAPRVAGPVVVAAALVNALLAAHAVLLRRATAR